MIPLSHFFGLVDLPRFLCLLCVAIAGITSVVAHELGELKNGGVISRHRIMTPSIAPVSEDEGPGHPLADSESAQSCTAAIGRESEAVVKDRGAPRSGTESRGRIKVQHFRSPGGTSGKSLGGNRLEPGGRWRPLRRVFMKSLKRAGKGGLPGAAAGLLQVLTLMWLRTIVNYQCRYGTSIGTAMSELYRQGGVLRFYRGVVFAILQNPLSRFGLTAANEGALALAEALPNYVPIAVTTWVASIVAGLWRMFLGPLDTCKTVLQVDGPEGFALLIRKVRSGNVLCLYNGAFAAAAATAVGHFPWFLTFNYLSKWIPTQSILWRYIMRNAVIGLAASIISDLVSNSIRVLKTTKQAGAAYETAMSYRAALALVLEADGWRGLLGRGLGTRILANGLQSMLFTVVWRYLHERYAVGRGEGKIAVGMGDKAESAAQGQTGGVQARGGTTKRVHWRTHSGLHTKAL